MEITGRSRGWCFTVNNPTIIDDLGLEDLKLHCEYLVYGKETGESGTPHYQGFVRFKHPQRLPRLREFLPRAHFEIQRGTAHQAAQYCKKDGDYVEHGELPQTTGETTKQRWRRIIELAEAGEVETIKEEYPGIYFLHRPKILSMRARQPIVLDELINEWWVGPTGTGKSRRLWSEFPDHYAKALNKWWDGYENESVVAIEEFNPDSAQYLAHHMKIWADRYPFSPEIKGSTLKKIRPLKIIVLSNYTIDQCFTREEDKGPLHRRFKEVHFRTLG